MSSQKYFEENQYVVFEGALDKVKCEQLTQHMFDLHQQGKLTKDDQCPQSDAIYGAPLFDNLLAEFAKPIGNHVGRELIPTYTYARIYRPGEILKKHKDRPSCEISATLTLGYDAQFNWPIYFDKNKEIVVTLEPGDLAVYKGCEIVHWRRPFKGNWHVQLFLHYVDANGPYKDYAYDKRIPPENNESTSNANYDNTVATQPNESQTFTFKDPIYDGIILHNNDSYVPGYTCINQDNAPQLMFTEEECNRIIDYYNEAYPNAALIGAGTSDRKDDNIRSAEIVNIPILKEFRWLTDKISSIVMLTNNYHFKYDIVGITHGLQLISYDAKGDIPGHYDWHSDVGTNESATRKISLTVQLSDPYKYKGCNLEVWDHGTLVHAPRDQGTVSLFPSYAPHRVTPIEEGRRYALVIWIHGTRRFL